MQILPCNLTRSRTYAVIRFNTLQLPNLPRDESDIAVALPNGDVVPAHFNPIRGNPNVTGVLVRRYVLRNVEESRSKPALIDVTGDFWRLYNIDDAVAVAQRERISTQRVKAGALSGADVSRLLARADRYSQAGERRKAYERLLRPSGLRRMILELMGRSCQVDSCTAAEDMERDWRDPAAGVAIVEVHHIEAVAHRVDHHPRNLCIVCGNHHRLIHGFGPWEIEHDGDDVILTRVSRSIRIVRDLSFLS